MVDSALESIARRQDGHSSGAIPDSDVDPRVYNGFAYGMIEGPGTSCYVRGLAGATFVRLGLADRLKRLLDFYRVCQADDGRYGTGYHVHNPRTIGADS